MSPRTSLVLGLVLASATVSCTVLEDMGGYTGGTAADSGIGATDSTVPGTDTAVIEDEGIPDTGAPDTGSPKDSSVADTGTPADTAVTDSGTDTGGATDTAVTDSGTDTAVTDTGVDASDAPPCGLAYANFGLSEVMVRAMFGAGDRREWLELTNYGSASLDVSNVVFKIFGGTTEKAALTFPPGTTLTAGEAVVIAIDKTTFVGDLVAAYSTVKVFDLGKASGDILTNSSANEVRLYGPGCTTPYETASVSRSSWPIGQSYAYPVPSTACPANGRLTGTNTLSGPWKDVTKDTANVYGNVPADGGTAPLYGTPGKANTGVACP